MLSWLRETLISSPSSRIVIFSMSVSGLSCKRVAVLDGNRGLH
jgi:hypothetical protein